MTTLFRVLVCLGFLGGLAYGDASQPVGIVPFTGPYAVDAQSAVERALGARAHIVAPDSSSKPGELVLSGVVSGKGRQAELLITVLTADGDLVGNLSYPTKGRRLAAAMLTQLATDVVQLVERAPPPPAPPVEQANDSEKVRFDNSPSAHLSGRGVELPPPPKPPKPPRPPRPVWAPFFDVTVGGLVSSRRLIFTPPQQPAARFGVAGGVYADATVYPLALLHDRVRGIFSGLGIGATVIAPFWPATRLDDGSGALYNTRELSIDGSIRWKFALRKILPRVDLTIAGGGGIHTFRIAKAAGSSQFNDLGPPDARYVYTRFSAQARVHVREWVSVFARFHGEYIPDAGPIEDRERYGLADSWGIGARAGVDFAVWRALRVGGLAYWDRMRMDFQRSAGTTRAASAAVDQYFGGVLFVGYSY